MATFYETLTAAVNDLVEHGFDSQQRLEGWLAELRRTALDVLVPETMLVRTLRDALTRSYRRAISPRQLFTVHRGLQRYTLDQVKPRLRAELDRRILASANLITLNRDGSIERTLQRFAGWATSIPIGGMKESDRRKVKDNIRRSLAGLPFEERRVIIDQGHKLSAAVNDIVAVGGGAIAATWHSHWREIGYDFRPDHKALDGKLFVVRDNWALKSGLIKLSGHGYMDEIEQPAQLPFCRCWFVFVYSPAQLPAEMLTEKGRATLEAVRHAA